MVVKFECCAQFWAKNICQTAQFLDLHDTIKLCVHLNLEIFTLLFAEQVYALLGRRHKLRSVINLRTRLYDLISKFVRFDVACTATP